MQAINDPTRPLVPMAEYEDFDYRTLNCWECWEAEGRICHHFEYDHGAIFRDIKSGNTGDGVCCKNNVEKGLCAGSRDDIVCSMPSIRDHGTKLWKDHKDVYSLDDRNYQMFAYCPGVDQHKCGISSEGSKNTDFILPAGETEQYIHTKEMKYMDFRD